MYFNKNKRANLVRFAFLIYMLVLGVAFGMVAFKGFTVYFESESIEMRQHLQLASFVGESVFSLDQTPIELYASIKIHKDISSVELTEKTIIARSSGTPFFRSIRSYPSSTIHPDKSETHTLILTGYDNELFLGEVKKECLFFQPPINIIQRDSFDSQFANLAKDKSIPIIVKSITDDFIDEIQIVFDIEDSSNGLIIYSNQQKKQLCSFTQYLTNYGLEYAVLPIDDFVKIQYPLIQDDMTYVVGGENVALLLEALEEYTE